MSGDNSGYGHGDGSGYGYGSDLGYGYGYGDGSSYGDGYDHGIQRDGGSMNVLRAYLTACVEAGELTAQAALREKNVELRRVIIECLGPERFFTQLNPTVIHRETDGCGNPRRLLRVPLKGTRLGYVQSVHLICPTTEREYYLGVPSTTTTCQEAVASTFGLRTDEYHPVRET